MKIEPLINVAFTHEYNDKSNSSRLFNIESKNKSKGRIRWVSISLHSYRSKPILNSWRYKEMLLDLSTTPEGLNFEFQYIWLILISYIIRSLLPDEQNDPDIQIR